MRKKYTIIFIDMALNWLLKRNYRRELDLLAQELRKVLNSNVTVGDFKKRIL